MKNPERVAALLAELRTLTENGFERHRIDVLERDLHEPPAVEQIDDKHQRFNDLMFYKQSSGHFNRALGIHQVVWTYYNGEIPDGCEIHHVDENKANNAIENLQCLTISEHRKLHRAILQKRDTICQICGKPITVTNGQPFCSSVCRRKADAVTRVCVMCGKEFKTNKYHHHFLCSAKCARDFQYRNNRETRTCPVCGKTFTTKKSDKKVCCSQKCGAIKRWHGQ